MYQYPWRLKKRRLVDCSSVEFELLSGVYLSGGGGPKPSDLGDRYLVLFKGLRLFTIKSLLNVFKFIFQIIRNNIIIDFEQRLYDLISFTQNTFRCELFRGNYSSGGYITY